MPQKVSFAAGRANARNGPVATIQLLLYARNRSGASLSERARTRPSPQIARRSGVGRKQHRQYPFGRGFAAPLQGGHEPEARAYPDA
ncbi:hypothetical protein [Roseivivax lentus]|uniref:hypothetical protein n=1 Tax=Roseivivax lentus TaxID=633194 RepID=UPI00117B9218|nr:hypothetical protein [Roseivivax lentus]